MIRIQEIRLALDESEKSLYSRAAKILRIQPQAIEKLTIYKKSVDARKKSNVFFSDTVDVPTKDEDKIVANCASTKGRLVTPKVYTLPENKRKSSLRPVIVGFGPAGLFARLLLALSGPCPFILARRQAVRERPTALDHLCK